MSDDEVNFEAAGDSGASHTIPIQAGAVKKGSYVMLKGKPCKVVEYSTSKTGKHGHAKASIVGIDIFTGSKYMDACPTSHNMQVPVVKRSEYQLVDVSSDGFVVLMTEQGETRSDLQLPKDTEGNLDDIAKSVQDLFDAGKSVICAVQEACGTEKIIAAKEMQ